MSVNGSSVPALDRVVRESGRRLLDRLPTLETPMLVARDRFARAQIRARTIANGLRYDAPPEPYRLIQIDPAAVERGVEFHVPKYTQAGVVTGGDWDRDDWDRDDCFRFADLDVYQAYVAHFEEGVPWEETPFYDRVVNEIERGVVKWGCRSEAEFRERCESIERLYERLRTDGYRTQAQLLAESDDDPIEFGRRSQLLTERLKDEIAVHVGRDGELIFSDGRNRLSMVKLIGLTDVPVRVLRRHSGWQTVRDAYVRGEEWAADYADHPDIEYLEFGAQA
ncbi:hypothetical protein [Halobaculum marinum]|uniref:Uncharacterized protein n=1 Tax=Halobaculum marinum TaxID=3031996 RepID=A0ABD5X386_9EURY|nr:hypothetical protein [Halobaculum sp. DT55]